MQAHVTRITNEQGVQALSLIRITRRPFAQVRVTGSIAVRTSALYSAIRHSHAATALDQPGPSWKR